MTRDELRKRLLNDIDTLRRRLGRWIDGEQSVRLDAQRTFWATDDAAVDRLLAILGKNGHESAQSSVAT